MQRVSTKITGYARSLRTNMTDAERKLWYAIRNKQLGGHRFRRQHPVGSYILDFACVDMKYAIEVDGGQHQDQVAYDTQRTRVLEEGGWQISRFWNNEVLEEFDGVSWTIEQVLHKRLPPS